MKIKNLFPRLSFLIGLTVATQISPVKGAQYFQDFSGAALGATSFGDGSAFFSTMTGASVGVVGTQKELQLTDPSTGIISAFILPPLDGNNVLVTAFSAKWNAVISGNFPNAADGFSFNFGQFTADTNLISLSYHQEAGYTNGISLSVQTYPGNSPGFYLRSHGTTIASLPYTSGVQWGTNNLTRHYFEVDWNTAEGMTVRVDHQTIFTNVVMTGFVPQVGDRVVWAARSGGASETLRLDNVLVRTRGNLKKLTVGSPFFQDARAFTLGSFAFSDDYNNINFLSISNAGYAGGSLPSAKAVAAYMIAIDPQTDASYAKTRPAKWVLEGSSNGGTNWGGSNPVTSGDLSVPAQSWVFPAGDTNAYSAWRLNVLTNGGDPNFLYIGGVELYEFTPGPAVAIAVADQGQFGFFDTNYHTSPLSFAFNVYAGGPTTVTFEWGTNTAYGNTFTTNVLTDTLLLAPLGFPEGGQDLHYRITLQDTYGTTQMADQVFQLPTFIGLNMDQIPTGLNLWQPMDTGIVAVDYNGDGAMDLLVTGTKEFFDSAGGLQADSCVLINNFKGLTPSEPGQAPLQAGLFRDVLGYIVARTFTPEFIPSRGATVIADFNNDDRLDIYLNGFLFPEPYPTKATTEYMFLGYDHTEIISGDGTRKTLTVNGGIYNSEIFKNAIIFPPGDFTTASVADFNGDGRTDMVICHGSPVNWNYLSDVTRPLAPVLGLNRGEGLLDNGKDQGVLVPDFINPNCPLPLNTNDAQLLQRPVEVDYDNDGNMDLLFCPGGLYHNDGYGRFTLVNNAAFNNPQLVNAAWGDYDNDGDMDVVIACVGSPSRLYRNDGAGVFTDTGITFDTIENISWDWTYFPPVLAWVDLNHDGQLDLYYRQPVLGASPQHKIYYNQHGVFTSAILPASWPDSIGIARSSMFSASKEAVTFADFNGDGRLDIGEAGGTHLSDYVLSGTESYLTFNFGGSSNQPPTAPSGLGSTTTPGQVVLNWGQTTDDATPAPSLTYNLRVGTQPGSDDMLSSLSFSNGMRRVSQPGNKGLAHTTTLRLPPGTYYWSVQAIDAGLAAGPFAPDQSFTISGLSLPSAYGPAITQPTPGSVTISGMVWCGYDNVTVTVEYGLTTNYDHSASQTLSTNGLVPYRDQLVPNVNPLTLNNFSINLPVLAGEAIHYRLVMTNSAGVVYTSDATIEVTQNLTIGNVSASQFTLTWPDQPGYELEYRDSLSTGTWLAVTNAPVLANGTNTLQLSNGPAMRFFRLNKP